MSGDLMPVLTSSGLAHSSNLDSTRKLLAPSLRRPASGIFSLHARGESRLIKRTKSRLEHTSLWLVQGLGRFRLGPRGRDTLGTLADWAGGKIGSVVGLAIHTWEAVPHWPLLLQCMRISFCL